MTEHVKNTDFRVELTPHDPQVSLRGSAEAVDAAIRAFSEAFCRTVCGNDVDLAANRRSLHKAISEFAAGAPQAGALTPGCAQGELTHLGQAIDVAADTYAQALLSRSRGWVTSVEDEFELRRKELFSAILMYCKTHRSAPTFHLGHSASIERDSTRYSVEPKLATRKSFGCQTSATSLD